jgi:xanthine dehydrogenase small subunit
MDSPHPEVVFSLNRRAISVRNQSASTTLLDFIRAQGLTGAKEGCAEGECGACAVLMVCAANDGATVRSVNSCLIPLPAVADREVLTVESLATAEGLHEAQRAMAERGGSQCGYCTPGFVISMVAEQFRAKPGARDIHALGGNLCRCTGYRPIADALQSLGPAPEAEFAAPRLGVVGYPGFSRPTALAECLESAVDPGVRFVAGNTDLGIATNLRGERFPHLVSLEGIEEMRFLREGADAVEIGAALTLSEIAERWQNPPEVFPDWLRLFASLPIRNRATLGGNLATASPIGDSAPLLLALDASLRLVSRRGERTVRLSDFFTGYRKTALTPGEIIFSILIPKPFPELMRFYKVAKRRMDDISTVAAAIAVTRDSSGRFAAVRVALGGVAAVPWRAREAEQALEGTRGDRGAWNAAAESLQRSLKPIGDHRGSAAYRLAMAQSLLGKFQHEVFV